ncbi:transglutaminase-like putative cysteine protease [Sphingomonas vulcanisoli]|uniref:Transglutaminase-like putative cysteine protease n=1 Tax=Sphingomonas vulcanisoli TaxID=1658060 RepID=A0ABX0TTT7_9SPHN|nr:transglutaminase family protein [Sphingomonas vulcanisoli]NIJ08934.1 transglutaminase-like putative cysteine protease [Sphingomonas vulcanisoli]
MRLFVRHRSEYSFSQPQARLVQLLRLTPRDHAGQSVVSWWIDVDRDARLKPMRDGYGNQATMLYIDGPIDRITLDVTGEVLTEDRAGMVIGAPEPLPPSYFLQDTPLTKADAAIQAIATADTDGGSGLDRAHLLADTIAEALDHQPTAIAADHDAIACFAAKAADPQGAAHVLIAAARAAGFPARYVAGHVYRPEAIDSHAAHGWAELFIEGYGWIGFDPSEGRCPTDNYIRVAIGLDHREAAPLSGLRTGGGDEALTIDVHVGPEPARD